jgi:mono/diheme cytochrome c family protein
MLAGRLTQSAPFSWLGEHKDLHAYVKNTMSRLGGSGLPDSGSSASTGGRGNPLDALIAYLHEMPAPNLDDALSEPRVAALAERGRELFFAEAGGCAGCHVGGIGTDGQRHDLASAARGDAERGFDTPSLRFVAGSAPFFHDGRYATLMDLLRATDSQMGHSFELSQSDVSALAAYLERL